MAWTYDSSLSHPKDQVRFLLGDTVTARQLIADEEITWLLKTEANIYMAAAVCAEKLASASRGISSKSVGGLSISYATGEGAGWATVAKNLRMRGAHHMTPTAGGISIADRDAMWEDADLLRPSIFSGLMENPGAQSPSHPTDSEDA